MPSNISILADLRQIYGFISDFQNHPAKTRRIPHKPYHLAILPPTKVLKTIPMLFGDTTNRLLGTTRGGGWVLETIPGLIKMTQTSLLYPFQKMDVVNKTLPSAVHPQMLEM